MVEHPSLVTRIAIGKAIGFVIVLAGFIALPYLAPDTGWQLRWGILFWYTTVGAVIGVFGVFTRHPVLMIPMPRWFRAPVIGGWMNFVLMFFAYDQMRVVLIAIFGVGSPLTLPLWFVLEGAVVGTVIGFCATRAGGEGPDPGKIDNGTSWRWNRNFQRSRGGHHGRSPHTRPAVGGRDLLTRHAAIVGVCFFRKTKEKFRKKRLEGLQLGRTEACAQFGFVVEHTRYQKFDLLASVF